MKKKVKRFLSFIACTAFLVVSLVCFVSAADPEPVASSYYDYTYFFGPDGRDWTLVSNNEGVNYDFSDHGAGDITFNLVSKTAFLVPGYTYEIQFTFYRADILTPLGFSFSPYLYMGSSSDTTSSVTLNNYNIWDGYGGRYYEYSATYTPSSPCYLRIYFDMHLENPSTSEPWQLQWSVPSITAVSTQQEQTDQITSAIDENTDRFFEENYNSPNTGGMDDLDSAEGNLNEQNEQGMQNANNYQTNALTAIAQYVGGFQALSAVVGKFSDLPFVGALLTLSIALGLFAFIVGMFGTAIWSTRREARHDRLAAERRNQRRGNGG